MEKLTIDVHETLTVSLAKLKHSMKENDSKTQKVVKT